MAVVEYQNIKKVFGAVTVIPDASLHIPDGSFTVFVGPSGCGKSTLLRLTAGLEDATDGKIFIDARDVTEERPTDAALPWSSSPMRFTRIWMWPKILASR